MKYTQKFRGICKLTTNTITLNYFIFAYLALRDNNQNIENQLHTLRGFLVELGCVVGGVHGVLGGALVTHSSCLVVGPEASNIKKIIELPKSNTISPLANMLGRLSSSLGGSKLVLHWLSGALGGSQVGSRGRGFGGSKLDRLDRGFDGGHGRIPESSSKLLNYTSIAQFGLTFRKSA